MNGEDDLHDIYLLIIVIIFKILMISMQNDTVLNA